MTWHFSDPSTVLCCSLNTENMLVSCFCLFFPPNHCRDKRGNIVFLYCQRHNCYFMIFNMESPTKWMCLVLIGHVLLQDIVRRRFATSLISQLQQERLWCHKGYVSPLQCGWKILKLCWATYATMVLFFTWLSIRVINHSCQPPPHKSLIHPGKSACPWWQIIGH